MRIHLIGVAGSGMGALAGLCKALGHHVSGSDVRFDPPMGPALQAWGIELHEGFSPRAFDPPPDLVIVGNVCRPDNPEARDAIHQGLRVTDMAHALAELALSQTTPVVIAGTHGKTTTTAMCAWLLAEGGKNPGFLIGGLPKNFRESFCPAGGRSSDSTPPPRTGVTTLRKVPFVIEGDEYDTAFFEKTPKFWHYQPEVAVLTSIEHDHIDIYPSLDTYLDAFAGFIQRIPQGGLLIASAADAHVVQLARRHARCEVAWYALHGDNTHGETPTWLSTPLDVHHGQQHFELAIAGMASGRFSFPLVGAHNIRNATAALAVATQAFGLPLDHSRNALMRFEGVRRRQDLLGTPAGIAVYDDFAHHPTAVDETLRALRLRHPTGSLFAVFEPRSATACRSLHQDQYPHSFCAASHAIFAPLGRDNIPADERLDVAKIVDEVNHRGTRALQAASVPAIIDYLKANATSGDTIALLSNGAFGGIHRRLLEALAG